MRTEYGIYMTDLARINVAGLRETDIGRFLESLANTANTDALV